MRKFLSLVGFILVLGLLPAIEPTLSADRTNHHRASKHTNNASKASKKLSTSKKKTTKISKNKKSKLSKSKTKRTRYAGNINNPNDGEDLKLESMSKDILSNEQ